MAGEGGWPGAEFNDFEVTSTPLHMEQGRSSLGLICIVEFAQREPFKKYLKCIINHKID